MVDTIRKSSPNGYSFFLDYSFFAFFVVGFST